MMQTGRDPEHYNDLSLTFEKAWAFIEPGASNRGSPAHTPVVATIDNLGHPQQRVMVLRAADRVQRSLRFHTDSRSAKIGQSGAASVLMYDPDEKVQLRLSGTLTAQTDGSETDEAWAHSTTFARRCYMAESAPGSDSAFPSSGLPEWIEGKQPDESQLTGYRRNFALMWFLIEAVEWLYLANAGHRRAIWQWNSAEGQWSGRWLVP